MVSFLSVCLKVGLGLCLRLLLVSVSVCQTLCLENVSRTMPAFRSTPQLAQRVFRSMCSLAAFDVSSGISNLISGTKPAADLRQLPRVASASCAQTLRLAAPRCQHPCTQATMDSGLEFTIDLSRRETAPEGNVCTTPRGRCIPVNIFPPRGPTDQFSL